MDTPYIFSQGSSTPARMQVETGDLKRKDNGIGPGPNVDDTPVESLPRTH